MSTGSVAPAGLAHAGQCNSCNRCTQHTHTATAATAAAGVKEPAFIHAVAVFCFFVGSYLYDKLHAFFFLPENVYSYYTSLLCDASASKRSI